MENQLKPNHNQGIDIIYMLPAFIFVFSIMLVRLHLFSMPLTDIYWTEALNSSTLSDLFTFWKAVFIIGASCVGFLVLLMGYIKKRIFFKTSFLYIPLLVYAVFVILSLAFSDYKYFAIHGMQEHFEGTFVLLSYVFMVVFLFNAVDSDRRVKVVIFFTFVIVAILGALGVAQATGHDFFSTAIGQKAITPNSTLANGLESWDMIDILAAQGQQMYNFSFTKGEVYQTVYNINYVPLYLILLIPIGAILFVHYSMNEDKVKRLCSVPFLALYCLFLYNFFAANSGSGYVGLVVAFFGVIFVFYRQLHKWIKPIVCLVLVSGLILGLLADRWIPEVKHAFSVVPNYIIQHIYADNSPEQASFENKPASVFAPLDYIETHDDCVKISVYGNVLVLSHDENSKAFVFSDESGELVPLSMIPDEEGVYEITDERFHDYFKISSGKTESGQPLLILTTKGYSWHFLYDGSKFLFRNKVGKTVSLSQIEHAGVVKDYYFGDWRGRIYDTTIPLLKHHVFLGSGADTFAFAFPQNDYVTIYNCQGGYNMSLVTDKAHNLYMQYWVNTGLISLLAWLTMVGYYLVGAVKQFRKRGFVDFCDFVNGGIFCGICGFLAVAFFNDGSVNTMPMFYTMLGTGLAINMRDKWLEAEVSVTENGPSTGLGPVGGKKKGKKAKAGAGVMPEV